MSGRYAVEIRPAARKELDDISPPDRARILRKIAALADGPRPSGVIKLGGVGDLWRLRAGDYRVVYVIEDERLVVTVVRVAHRYQVYRGLQGPRPAEPWGDPVTAEELLGSGRPALAPSERAQHAALHRWAKEDPTLNAPRGQKGLRAKFLREVDEHAVESGETLTEAERARRLPFVYARMALVSRTVANLTPHGHAGCGRGRAGSPAPVGRGRCALPASNGCWPHRVSGGPADGPRP